MSTLVRSRPGLAPVPLPPRLSALANAVAFCRHPSYETMHDAFRADFSFRAEGSRFSILKSQQTLPGPDECFSFLEMDSRLVFHKLLGLEIRYAGLRRQQSAGLQLYNTCSYHRTHIEEFFCHNGIHPLPPLEGACVMHFSRADELSVVYELRATSPAAVPVWLRLASEPVRSAGDAVVLRSGGFSFTCRQKVFTEFTAGATLESSRRDFRFSERSGRLQTAWVCETIAGKHPWSLAVRIRFAEAAPAAARRSVQRAAAHRSLARVIKRVAAICRRLPKLDEKMARFQSLYDKAAGILYSLEFLERDRRGHAVLTVHSGKCGVAATWFWDTAFLLHGLALMGEAEAGAGAIRLLCNGIREDGTPPCFYVNGRYEDGYQQPTLAWGVVNFERRLANPGLLRECYPALRAYVRKWLTCHDADGDGLVEYPKGSVCWDDALRWQDAFPLAFREGEKWPRANWGKMAQDQFHSVDTNAHLLLECRALAVVAQKLGCKAEADQWSVQAKKLSQRVHGELFNPASGAYEDREIRHGRFTGMITPASFLPVFAGVAPLPIARRMCRRFLLDPSRFDTAMPFPTLDRAHPAFRSGGFLYEPTGYPEGTLCQNAYIHGRSGLYISYWCIGALWQAGLRREADQRAERILEVAARLPSLYEYYDPLTGQSAGHADFGWAAAAVLLLASRAYRRGPLSL